MKALDAPVAVSMLEQVYPLPITHLFRGECACVHAARYEYTRTQTCARGLLFSLSLALALALARACVISQVLVTSESATDLSTSVKIAEAKACSLMTAYGQNTFSESMSGVWEEGCVNVRARVCACVCTDFSLRNPHEA